MRKSAVFFLSALFSLSVVAGEGTLSCSGRQYSGGPADNPENLKVKIELTEGAKRYEGSKITVSIEGEGEYSMIAHEQCNFWDGMGEEEMKCADTIGKGPGFNGVNLYHFPPQEASNEERRQKIVSVEIFKDMGGLMEYRSMSYLLENCTLVK